MIIGLSITIISNCTKTILETDKKSNVHFLPPHIMKNNIEKMKLPLIIVYVHDTFKVIYLKADSVYIKIEGVLIHKFSPSLSLIGFA